MGPSATARRVWDMWGGRQSTHDVRSRKDVDAVVEAVSSISDMQLPLQLHAQPGGYGGYRRGGAVVGHVLRKTPPPLRFVASSLHLPSIGIFGFRVNVNENDINSY